MTTKAMGVAACTVMGAGGLAIMLAYHLGVHGQTLRTIAIVAVVLSMTTSSTVLAIAVAREKKDPNRSRNA
jgi:hypothetical protein